MNFFTSLAQLRHGLGGGNQPPAPDTFDELANDIAPSFKEAFDQDPPAPLWDDAAIMARAALAAGDVAEAAEVEYEKHLSARHYWSALNTSNNATQRDLDIEMANEDPDTDLDAELWNYPFPEPPVADKGLELEFNTEDAASAQIIEGFDPDVEALEVEIQREPGDDRPVTATDLELFLHDDGSYGAIVTLRLAATDAAPAASTTLKLCGADDIDLKAISIKVLNPTV